MTELNDLSRGRMPARVIQLVPRFRPDADGVGESALALGDALWKQHNVPTDFVVWRPARPVPEVAIPNGTFPHRIIRTQRLQHRELAQVLDQITSHDPKPIMLLHYVSYGYSDQGIPWWLPGMLRQFIQRGGRVVTFFHELYAKGRFPSKTWLTSGLQRHIFQELLALSAVGITTSSEYLEEMSRENSSKRPLVRAGVCSSVGELETYLPRAQRRRRLAIFGQPLSRKQLYEQQISLLQRIVTHLDIQEVADIGAIGDPPHLDWAAAQLGGKLRVYGPLAPDEVGQLLFGSLAGAVSRTYSLRFKSSVVGAYQAYGLPTIIFRPVGEPEPSEDDPACPTPDRILAFAAGSPDLLSMLDEAGREAFAFYQRNRSYNFVLGQILHWLQLDLS